MDSTSFAYQQGKAAALVVIMWFVIVLSSAMLAGIYIAYNELRIIDRYDGTALYIFAWVFAAGAALAMMTAQENYGRIKKMGDNEPPQRDIPTGRPIYESKTRPQRMEVQTTENTLQRCIYPFEPVHWLRLVNSMQRYAEDAQTGGIWIWSRDKTVRPAAVFTNDITPGVSPTRASDWRAICYEFERLWVIRKRGSAWHVTRDGKWMLSQMAGLNVVP